jgi:hypothetical protein
MSPPELHRLLLGPIHRTGIDYMVTGGVAAIAYGEPRLTNDVDIVVRASAADAARFAAEFPSADYYVPPPEAMERELARPRHGHFNLIHNETGLRADVYVAGDDPLHAWALERRHAESMGGETVWFAPIEYVIVRKLEYFAQMGSPRHLRDIRAMIRVSGDMVDQNAVSQFVHARGLREAWKEAQQPDPERS